MDNRKIYRVTLASNEVSAFMGACEDSEWYALDTGERVMTDEGADAEAVLLVEPTPRQTGRAATALVH